MFRLETDRAAGRITVTVAGFLSMEDVDRFVVEVTAAAQEVRRLGKQQTILYDYTAAAIQSQEVVAALQEFAMRNPLKSRRVALYTGGQLAKLQAKRIAGAQDRFAVFDDRAAAVAWLDGD